MRLNPVYVTMADAQGEQEWSYRDGLNDPRVASLRAFKAFHKDARVYGIIDGHGRERWTTKTGARILAIGQRMAAQEVPQRLRMADIAQEANCNRSTVARWLLKFTAWGMLAVEVTRGRLGGVRIGAVWASDWVTVLVDKARERLYALTQKAWKRRRLKGATTVSSKEVGADSLPVTVGAHFRMGTFAEAVYAERARLAIIDPEGEKEAVAPLDYGRAFYILANGAESEHQAEQRRQDIDAERAIAEARFWFKANGG